LLIVSSHSCFLPRLPCGWAVVFQQPPSLSIQRNQDYVSKNFERWKELASLTSREQDPAKLTELAHEINLVLTQKIPYLDPPLHAAGSREEGQRDVPKANTEGKVCFT